MSLLAVVGAVLILVGLFAFLRGRHGESENSLEFGTLKFKTNTPSLVLVVLGVGCIAPRFVFGERPTKNRSRQGGQQLPKRGQQGSGGPEGERACPQTRGRSCEAELPRDGQGLQRSRRGRLLRCLRRADAMLLPRAECTDQGSPPEARQRARGGRRRPHPRSTSPATGSSSVTAGATRRRQEGPASQDHRHDEGWRSMARSGRNDCRSLSATARVLLRGASRSAVHACTANECGSASIR